MYAMLYNMLHIEKDFVSTTDEILFKVKRIIKFGMHQIVVQSSISKLFLNKRQLQKFEANVSCSLSIADGY